MFKWYMEAEVCYVYLTDVAEDGSIAECRWFTRGWTLQELVAPTSVDFYDKKWHFINDKISISSELASVTGIDESVLRCGHSLEPPLLKDHNMTAAAQQKYSSSCSCGRPGSMSRLPQLQDYCIAQKMSWASKRETTRDEDMAYCLLGLFNVNLPLLYGEGGSSAFFRLQREIMQNSHDQSILLFQFPSGIPLDMRTALASCPNEFLNSWDVHFRDEHFRRLTAQRDVAGVRYTPSKPVTADLTKFGVTIELLVAPEMQHPDSYMPVTRFGFLDFRMGKNPLGRPAIPLYPLEPGVAPETFLREEGLFQISPEHHDHVRDLRVLTGESSLRTLPDRKTSFRHRHHYIDLRAGKIDVQALRRQKVTIIQNQSPLRPVSIYPDRLPAPIRCISNSYDCQPYSVEGEARGLAILQKTGYPRLLVYTFPDEGSSQFSSSIWVLRDIHLIQDFSPDAESAGDILKKLKAFNFEHTSEKFGFSNRGLGPYPGSNVLVVPGSPDLMVEVRVKPVEFLDWTIPKVTVTTSQVSRSKL